MAVKVEVLLMLLVVLEVLVAEDAVAMVVIALLHPGLTEHLVAVDKTNLTEQAELG